SLVQIAGDEVEADGRALAQALQQVEQGEGVLPAGNTHQEAVAVHDQPELLDGAADLVQQPLLELSIRRQLSHAAPVVTPHAWHGSTCGLKENAPGPLYVDETCIDCDTCRQMAPEIYGETR